MSYQLAPVSTLDVLAVIIFLFCCIGLVLIRIRFFKDLKDELEPRYLFISGILGLIPGILFSQVFSFTFDPLTSFVIYYSCFTLIIFALIPGFVELVSDTHTPSNTIEPETEGAQDRDEEPTLSIKPPRIHVIGLRSSMNEQKFRTSEREEERKKI